MKIVALLSGLLASAFAWAAGVYVDDIGAQFLALWPETVSLQFLGVVVWHTIVAAALVGGALVVVSPISGAILLAGVAAGWMWLGTILPIGIGPQTIVPAALAAVGVLAAIGAMVRGQARRLAEQQPSEEEVEREAALRLVPEEPSLPAFDLSDSVMAEAAPPAEPPRQPARASRAPTVRGEEGPPREVTGLLAANVAALVVLSVAVGILLYSELRSGDLMAAFSPSGPQPAYVSEGIPSVEKEAISPARTEEAAVTAEANEWPDPFAYCSAVGTQDFPDRRYAGPHLVAAIADALRIPTSTPPDRVSWRCYEGELMACSGFDGPVCAKTPTEAEMSEFCTKNPNASELQAPNGRWSCNGTRPEIPAGASWPVDARGFFPAVWIEIAPEPSAG